MIAGILPLGFRARYSGVQVSLAPMLMKCGSYGRPVSSSMIDTFTPLGVGVE